VLFCSLFSLFLATQLTITTKISAKFGSDSVSRAAGILPVHGRGQDGRATSALSARVERQSARSFASIPGFCVQRSKRDLLSLDKPRIIGYNANWLVCRAGPSNGARQNCAPDVAPTPRSASREWTEQSENVYENKALHLRFRRVGANVAFERRGCTEGAVRSDCTACPDLSLRDIADPRTSGSAPTYTARLTDIFNDRSGNVYENKG
jgi:hypothetical protein